MRTTLGEKLDIADAVRKSMLEKQEAERQEKLAKNRAYKAEWRKNNREKIAAADRRYYLKKTAAKEAGGVDNGNGD